MSDLAAAIRSIEKSFEDFKANNDERLSEIEKKGHADPLLVEKVNKNNAEISALTEEVQKALKAADEAALAAQRLPVGDKTDELKAHASNAKLFSNLVGAPVEAKEYVDYKAAFSQYMRRGEAIKDNAVRNALSVGSDPDGGYWVTPDMSGRIAELVYETTPMRQLANVQSISTDALEGMNDLDEAGSGGWVSEIGTRSDTTTPQIGKWRIPVHELYAQPKATQTILDDASVNVETWLSGKVSERLSRVQNDAFLNGDGSGKPRGLLTYDHGVPSSSTWNVIEQVASGAAGAFAASDPGDNLIDLVFSLKAAYRGNAQFLMNRATVAEARKLKDGDGNYLWQPEFTARQGGLLLGYPIMEGEDMPDIAANSLSIAFGDFNQGYQIVDRMGIRVLRDPFTDKPYIKFYTTMRVGGDVVNFEAVKLMKFAASV